MKKLILYISTFFLPSIILLKDTLLTDDKNFTNNILQDVISNLIGGIIFTFLLFFLNEYILKMRNINGEWEMKNHIDKSTYNPHIGISIVYKVHIIQIGNEITGRAEKIKDLNSDGTLHHEYPHKNRIEANIVGSYKRNFLRHSKIYINILEKGTERETSTSLELKIPIFNKKKIEGTFISTASNSSGTSDWTKTH